MTACPTNTGTGMRASVMMHLPALTMTENINRVISSAGSLGIEVRGLYGEGTKAYGNLYQISNRITLGLSESQVIEKLTNVVNQIIDMETKARNMLKEKIMTSLRTDCSAHTVHLNMHEVYHHQRQNHFCPM